ncbi:MAG: hypothetical protein VX777_07375 [Chlamydiota bacterium]|nr:hypothetical protein [Chlamydiota bacterium]
MSFELNNILNTGLYSFGTNCKSLKLSLIFLGDSQKCKDNKGKYRTITCIYPLDFNSPDTFKRAHGNYTANRVALISENNNIFSLMVHEDFINNLPSEKFYLGSKNGVIKDYKIRKHISVESISKDSYTKLFKSVQTWAKKYIEMNAR